MSITFEIEEGGVYTGYESFWRVHEWYVIHRFLLYLADLVYKYHMIYNLILYDICYFIQKSLKMKIHGLQYCIYYIHTSRNFRETLFLALSVLVQNHLVLLKCILCLRLWGYCHYLLKIQLKVNYIILGLCDRGALPRLYSKD